MLLEKNAYLIRDLYDETGNFLDYVSFKRKFNITEGFPFTLYFGLILAIPNAWKTNKNITDITNENILRLVKFTSHPRVTKITYHYFINKTALKPRSISKWQGLDCCEYNWNAIFTLPHVVVRDVKIQYFQFRFLHRIIGTNTFLFRIGRRDSPLCTFCEIENETLDHLFCLCPFVRTFWYIASRICLKDTSKITLDNVKFGYIEDIKHPVNFYLLHAKYFIFNCKQNEKLPDVLTFLNNFNFLLENEYLILKKNDERKLMRFKECFK